MVSFCDIPLTRTNDFRSRYGNHAIGLNKLWGMDKGINPVFYVHNIHILHFLHDIRLSTEGTGFRLNGSWYQYPTPFSLPWIFRASISLIKIYTAMWRNISAKTRKREKINAITKKMSGDISYMNERILIGLGTKRSMNNGEVKIISLKQQKPWKTKSSLSQLRILAILSWKRTLKYPRLSPISERSQSSEERARHWLLDEMDLLCAKVTSIERIDKDF